MKESSLRSRGIVPTPECGFVVWPVRRYFTKRLTGLERIQESSGQLPVEPCTLLPPGESFLGYLTDNLRRITSDDLSLGDRHVRRNEAEGANDAAGSDDGVVHDNSVHPDEGVAADARAVNDRPMANVRCFLKVHRNTGKHVNDAILLDVAAILDDDLAPVAADDGAGADIHLSSDSDIADHGRVGVNERVLADYGSEALKGEDVCHVGRLQLTVGGGI